MGGCDGSSLIRAFQAPSSRSHPTSFCGVTMSFPHVAERYHLCCKPLVSMSPTPDRLPRHLTVLSCRKQHFLNKTNRSKCRRWGTQLHKSYVYSSLPHQPATNDTVKATELYPSTNVCLLWRRREWHSSQNLSWVWHPVPQGLIICILISFREWRLWSVCFHAVYNIVIFYGKNCQPFLLQLGPWWPLMKKGVIIAEATPPTLVYPRLQREKVSTVNVRTPSWRHVGDCDVAHHTGWFLTFLLRC